jgi:hypothetical protein
MYAIDYELVKNIAFPAKFWYEEEQKLLYVLVGSLIPSG